MLVGRAVLVSLAALSLALPLGCLGGTRTMGEICERSEQCRGEGTCLSGVCAGYGCTKDADCENEHECVSVGGTQACALLCDTDEDCSEQQSCREQEEGGVCL